MRLRHTLIFTLFTTSLTSFIFLSFHSPARGNESSQNLALERLLVMSLDELIEVEVTVATGTPKPLKLAPSVATVITAEDMKKIGARTINEALETVSGLHVGVSTKNVMSQVYSVRGINTSVNPQVLLMMNGIPISSPWTGTRAWFNMPVSSISRIEVVRGPGSAVNGADAFAGTINIITKDSNDIDGTESGARGGSFDTYDMFVQHGGIYQGWNIFAGLEYQTSEGDPSRTVDSDLQTVLDRVLGTNATETPGGLETGYKSLDMHFNLNKDNWTLRLWGELQERDTGDGVTNVVARGGEVSIDQYLAELNYKNDTLNDDFILIGRLYFMYNKVDSLLQLFPKDSVLPIGADGNIDFVTPAGATYFPGGVWGEPVQKDKQTGIDLTGIYSGIEEHRLRTAIGYKHLREEIEEYKNFGPGVLDGSQPFQDSSLTDVTGTDYVYAPNKTREIIYTSLQDEWGFAKKWELVVGLRYDYYSDFGDTLNPRVALVWETQDDLTMKVLYGQAFRPPSFNELYVQNNPSNNGNEDLEPETIQTIEFVADYQPLTNLHLRMNLFYYEVEDLIELVPDPGQTTQTSQNSKNQEGQGFELEAELLATKKLLLRGNLSYQDSEDADTGDTIPDAPQWQAYFNIHWMFMPEWEIDGQYHWIAGRERSVTDNREDIDDNHIVNLSLRRSQLFENWEVALAIRNLFNEDVREPGPAVIPDDYPMEERSFWAELRFHF